jgi:hypothetical protein
MMKMCGSTLKQVDAEDGVTDKRIYFSKTSDAVGTPFLAAGYWYWQLYMWNKPEVDDTFLLDEKCYEQYAKKLIPRAIGYSAALLDYFFRGTIEITPPNDFVYSVIDGSATDQKFEYIKANLRNATPDEEMMDGTLVAIARYKRIINYSPIYADGNEPLDPQSRESQYSYSISAQDTTLLQTSAPTEVTFDFSADPIPAGVTDLTLQVVFLGTLGNELDTAVAVGMVDLTEPTHITFFNSTDEMPNADGSALVPAKNESNPRDFIVAFTGTDPDSSDGVQNKTANFGFYETYDPLIVVEDLAPGGYFRIITLLDSRQHAYTVMDTGTRPSALRFGVLKIVMAPFIKRMHRVDTPQASSSSQLTVIRDSRFLIVAFGSIILFISICAVKPIASIYWSNEVMFRKRRSFR